MTILPSIPRRALVNWDTERWEICSFTCLLCDYSVNLRDEFIDHLKKHAVYGESVSTRFSISNGTTEALKSAALSQDVSRGQLSDVSEGSIHIRVDSDTSRQSESLNNSLKISDAEPRKIDDESSHRSSTPQRPDPPLGSITSSHRESTSSSDVTPIKRERAAGLQEENVFLSPAAPANNILDLSVEPRTRAESPRSLLQPIALSPMVLRASQEQSALMASDSTYSALYGPWPTVYSDVFGYHSSLHGYMADAPAVTSAAAVGTAGTAPFVTPEKKHAEASVTSQHHAMAVTARATPTPSAPSPTCSDPRSPFLGESKPSGGEIEKHSCVQCGTKCESFDALCLHMKSHGGSIYSCSLCIGEPSAIFTTREALDNHVSTAHGNAENSKTPVEGNAEKHADKGVCSLCGDRSHGACFHEGKKFVCPQCGCIYANKQGLRNHIQGFHEGRKKYVCSVCQTGFMQKSQFLRHVTRVHPTADVEVESAAWGGKRKSTGAKEDVDGKKGKFQNSSDLGVRALDEDGDHVVDESSSASFTLSKPPCKERTASTVTSPPSTPQTPMMTSPAAPVTSQEPSPESSQPNASSSVLNVPVVRTKPTDMDSESST